MAERPDQPRKHAVRLMLLLALFALLAVGCDSDDEEPELSPATEAKLLRASDLGDDVEARAVVARPPSAGPCGSLRSAERNLFEDARPGTAGLLQYELANGDVVLSGVAELGAETYVTQHVDAVRLAVDDCSGVVSETLSYEPLTGLPDGAAGYRAVERFEDDDDAVTTRVTAPAGDAVVLVGVSRADGEEPRTQVQQLLLTAVERATAG